MSFMNIRWKSDEYTMNIRWLCHEYSKNMHWIYDQDHEYTIKLRWVWWRYDEYTLNIRWVYHEYTMNLRWVSWIYDDYRMNIMNIRWIDIQWVPWYDDFHEYTMGIFHDLQRIRYEQYLEYKMSIRWVSWILNLRSFSWIYGE